MVFCKSDCLVGGREGKREGGNHGGRETERAKKKEQRGNRGPHLQGREIWHLTRKATSRPQRHSAPWPWTVSISIHRFEFLVPIGNMGLAGAADPTGIVHFQVSDFDL